MSRLRNLLVAHPDWIAPRSDQHTVIGVPDSRDHRKTFVEPGGSFSPGVATFGITIWIYDHTHTHLYAPEELPLAELRWQWAEGHLPLLQSQWAAGQLTIAQELFAQSLSNEHNIMNTLHIKASNQGSATIEASVYVVIRPYGPAGGPLYQLALQENTVRVNEKITILAEKAASRTGVVSFEQHQQEISVLLKHGHIPQQQEAHDRDGLCSGVLSYDFTLAPGQSHALTFDAFVHPLEHDYLNAFQHYHARSYADKRAQMLDFWRQQLYQVQLELPDKRFSDAYYSMLAQFLMATVDHEVRISTITYPLFWLRDGAYLINALDKAGLHGVVRQQLERLQDRIFASGFGAEPDAFGEGIWIFLTHFLLTHDTTWLQEVYPAVKTRAEWIIRARHTQNYLYADTEARVPGGRFAADTDLICEPARDGLIQGRMDWHRPLIWINAFSYLGLHGTAQLATAIGYEEDARHFEQEAEELRQALHIYGIEQFGKNERDTVCAFWPTGAFSRQKEAFRDYFEHWWQRVRLQGRGEYRPEPLWKYFEIGQAHNYLYLGERNRAVQTVNYYLKHHDVQNLYGWLEDDHDIAEHWSQIEGWYKQPSRQPHGWVAAELFLLLRDMLLYEDEQTLIIGSGIPQLWLQEKGTITFAHMPSHFGPVDTIITVHDSSINISIRFTTLEYLPAQIVIALPWSGEQLTTNMGTVEKDTLIIPQENYRESGQLNLHVNR